MASETFEPKIIAFVVTTALFAAADLAGSMRLKYPTNVRIIRLPCSGRAEVKEVLEAFLSGADGVLVVGCLEGDCHFIEGNFKAKRRIQRALTLLEEAHINPERLEFRNNSAAMGPQIAELFTEFTEKIRVLGPNTGANNKPQEIKRGGTRMIFAERKEMAALEEMLSPFKKIALVGCKGCVTVCNAGGMKEVGILATQLKLARKQKESSIDILEITLERQCDREYVDQLDGKMDDCDAVLSMACGVGVQFVAERYNGMPVLPALNTTFMGGAEAPGEYAERCQGCGACKLHLTGGICPISRCSKSLLNGPCGGSMSGKCEIDKSVDCGWQLIVDRLVELDMMDNYEKSRKYAIGELTETADHAILLERT